MEYVAMTTMPPTTGDQVPMYAAPARKQRQKQTLRAQVAREAEASLAHLQAAAKRAIGNPGSLPIQSGSGEGEDSIARSLLFLQENEAARNQASAEARRE